MRIGKILADFERLGKARDRLVEAIELHQRFAAVEPGVGIARRHVERATVGFDRFGVAPELDQSDAAIVMHARMAGRELQRGVEIGQSLLGKSEHGPGETAIEPRLDVVRRARQHLLEFGQRLAPAAPA